MKTIANITLIAMLTSCTTTVVTTTDAKGGMVTTKTTSPAQSVVTAIGTATAAALVNALQGFANPSNPNE